MGSGLIALLSEIIYMQAMKTEAVTSNECEKRLAGFTDPHIKPAARRHTSPESIGRSRNRLKLPAYPNDLFDRFDEKLTHKSLYMTLWPAK